jgi:hypothetical protein
MLRNDLFVDGIKKCGELAFDEIFFFAPALALGGSEDIKFVQKGNIFVHYDLLEQLLGEDFTAV